jgi:hypothetical protein
VSNLVQNNQPWRVIVRLAERVKDLHFPQSRTIRV